MDIIFDFSPILTAANQDPVILAWFLFSHGGWALFVIFISRFVYDYWLIEQQHKWFDTNKFVILAIDIPKDTEQTPKAVEHLFATISGAHTPLSAKEIYAQGIFQLSFSFEIVSIDGYVQFLIRTPSQYRDLIESSIYSQYPDAEITEVEDYIDAIPDKYPNDHYNVWGSEVILTDNDVLPIRTYPHFEDNVSGEFKDPMASLLETMSKIQVGEQVWIQIIVRPTDIAWTKRSLKEAYKLAGKKMSKSSESMISRMMSSLFGLFFLSTGETWFFPTGAEGGKTQQRNKEEMPSLMLHLTPGERSAIEAIETKASKIGFYCKIRLVYISPLEQFASNRVVSSVFGSIKQFNALDLNSFKPDPKTKTQIMYFFIEYRKNRRRERIVKAYKRRSGVMGHQYFILNTEELATIWHFPSKFVKSPLLQKTESKKAEPPFILPRQQTEDKDREVVQETLKKQLLNNNPFGVDLDNKYFEGKFAKKNINDIDEPKSKGTPPPNLPTV